MTHTRLIRRVASDRLIKIDDRHSLDLNKLDEALFTYVQLGDGGVDPNTYVTEFVQMLDNAGVNASNGILANCDGIYILNDGYSNPKDVFNNAMADRGMYPSDIITGMADKKINVDFDDKWLIIYANDKMVTNTKEMDAMLQAAADAIRDKVINAAKTNAAAFDEVYEVFSFVDDALVEN